MSPTWRVVRPLVASLPLLCPPASAQPLQEAGVLTVSDPFLGDNIGVMTARYGDTLLVGSPYDDVACPGDPNCNSGSVYVFRRGAGGPGSWREIRKLVPSDPGPQAYFGNPIAFDGTTAAIGASGAAYVFERNLGAQDRWGERTKLLPPNPTAHGFGGAVALQGVTLVITAQADAYPCPNEPQSCVAGFGAVGAIFSNRACLPELPACDAGAVYLYDLAPLLAGPCVESPTTLCLLDGRFRVEVFFETAQGQRGTGRVGGHLSDESGHFWFFRESNPELFVKVVDACTPPFDRFWFFAAGLTNVRVEIRVTDTTNGEMRFYERPLGPAFLPIQDTAAFDTCP